MSQSGAAPNGNGRWQMITAVVAVLTLLAGFIVGGWQLINLTIKQQASNLETRIAALENEVTTGRTLDAESIRDRSNLHAQFEANRTGTTEKLAEIETQFNAMNAFANMTAAEQHRLIGLLWQKVYGQELPPTAYYPSLQRNNSLVDLGASK